MPTVSMNINQGLILKNRAQSAHEDVTSAREAIPGEAGPIDVSGAVSRLGEAETWLGTFRTDFDEVISAFIHADSGDPGMSTLEVPYATLAEFADARREAEARGDEYEQAVLDEDYGRADEIAAEFLARDADPVWDQAFITATGPAAVDFLYIAESLERSENPDGMPTETAERFATADREVGFSDTLREDVIVNSDVDFLDRVSTEGDASEDFRVGSAQWVTYLTARGYGGNDTLYFLLEDISSDGELSARYLAEDFPVPEGYAGSEEAFDYNPAAELFSDELRGYEDVVVPLIESAVVDDSWVEPGSLDIRTREEAALNVIRGAGAEDADFDDDLRPVLASVYGEWVDDFAAGASLAPGQGAVPQVIGRDGVELGEEEIRTFLAEVALHPESYQQVYEATVDHTEGLVDEIGGDGSLSTSGSGDAVNRELGSLWSNVYLAEADAILKENGDGEEAAQRFRDSVDFVEGLVTDPGGTAAGIAVDVPRDLIAGLIEGDDREPQVDPAITTIDLDTAAAEYDALAGFADDPTAQGQDEAEAVVTAVTDFNDSLPPSEQFLDADGTIRPELTDTQRYRLSQVVYGSTEVDDNALAGRIGGQRQASEYFNERVASGPPSEDNV